jgi:acyl carrier protein
VTPDDARALVVRALSRIAPELDPATIDPDAELQDELDLDSMDFLNLVTAVSEAIHVEIPERDYPQLATLEGFTSYVAAASVG